MSRCYFQIVISKFLFLCAFLTIKTVCSIFLTCIVVRLLVISYMQKVSYIHCYYYKDIFITCILGYLVLVDSNIIASKDSWNGETISIRLKSAETIIAITQIKVQNYCILYTAIYLYFLRHLQFYLLHQTPKPLRPEEKILPK